MEKVRAQFLSLRHILLILKSFSDFSFQLGAGLNRSELRPRIGL
jgi:hypothetical protein